MAIVLEGFLDDLASIGGGLAGSVAGTFTLGPGVGTAAGAALGASAGAGLAGGSSGGAKITGNPTPAECEAMAKAYDGLFPAAARDIRAQCAARRKAAPKKKSSSTTKSSGGVLDIFNAIKAKVEQFNATIAPAPPPTPAQLAAQTITRNVQAAAIDIGGKVGGKNSILLKSTNAGAPAPVDRGAVKAPDKTSSLPILLGVGAAAAGALYLWHSGQKKRGSKGLW